MKKLLSLPGNLVKYFHKIKHVSEEEYYCSSDPEGERVGSGGGTAWLLNQCWKDETGCRKNFDNWLSGEKRIIIHAGGQGRRVPAYAPSGKILTPIPVFRWKRGQRIDQDLLDLEVNTFEEILSKGNSSQNTIIASGDAFVRINENIANIPDADVVCYGLWANKELASSHGVFICPRNKPDQLKYMLQKPSVEKLNEEVLDNMFLIDTGIWVLSDRAVKILVEETGVYGKADALPAFYDFYGEFGLNLGTEPLVNNGKINSLSVAVVPLKNGIFNHFGTSPELISSMLSIQNEVVDQREILHRGKKVHPSIFLQNTFFDFCLTSKNKNLWIENSYLNKNWKIGTDSVITGIPENGWRIDLPSGMCFDMVPFESEGYCLRLYNINDKFRGRWNDEDTKWLGMSFTVWMEERNLDGDSLFGDSSVNDIQSLPLFPVVEDLSLVPLLYKWMMQDCSEDELSKNEGKKLWLTCRRLSADDLTSMANLERLFTQRRKFLYKNMDLLRENSRKNVFFQIDLDHMAKLWVEGGKKLEPKVFNENKFDFKEMQEWMFRARVKELENKGGTVEEGYAFRILQQSLLSFAKNDKVKPVLSVFPDQIVWGRSPIRIDIAGGWTDTPPNCLINGGKVVAVSLKLNGQDPLQVYVRRADDHVITLRSIDLGTSEVIRDWVELENCSKIGNEFSIAKAALCICGFSQEFCSVGYASLSEQLVAFGGGLEISTLAAIPKGSGLGTSSALAATIIAAIADFCGITWDRSTICRKSLVLEQMLTSGGGWQDQYGSVMPGVKLMESDPGVEQNIRIKWGPEKLFKNPEYKSRMLLYYTGITRVAKNILADIVKSMFLNGEKNLSILESMKGHALKTFDDIQCGDMDALCDDIRYSWKLNKALDKGTNPPAVESLIKRIDKWCSCYKLGGAGGGGYMFIIAKDVDSAIRIRKELQDNPSNENARFVEMSLSDEGLVVTRS